MDILNEQFGYESLLGVQSKIVSMYNGCMNKAKLLVDAIDVLPQEEISDVFDALVEKGYQRIDLANELVCFGATTTQGAQALQGEDASQMRCVYIEDILNSLNLSLQEEPTDYPVPVYGIMDDRKAIVGSISLIDAMNIVNDQQTMVESAIQAADNLLQSFELEVDNINDIVNLIIDKMPSVYSDDFKSYINKILHYFDGQSNEQVMVSAFYAIYSYFGYSNDENAQTYVSTYGEYAPINAWISSWYSFTRTITSVTFWTHFSMYTLSAFMKVVNVLGSWIKAGFNTVFNFVGPLFANALAKSSGYGGAIEKASKFGDNVIGNVHSEMTLHTNVTGTYVPAELSYLDSNINEFKEVYTMYTLGAKRVYTINKTTHKITATVYPKLVNQWIVKEILYAHNVTLPIVFKETTKGHAPTLFLEQTDNLNSISDYTWEAIFRQLQKVDLTYPPSGIELNNYPMESLLYAKILDLLSVGFIMYKSSHITDGYGGYSISTFMKDNIYRATYVYDNTGNFTNRAVLSYACRIYNRAYPLTIPDYVTDWNDENGFTCFDIDATQWNVSNRDWYISQLYPLVYVLDTYLYDNTWFSYISRYSLIKPMWKIADDADLSNAAAWAIVKPILVTVAAIAAVYAIIFTPKIIKYKRSIAMQMETAAFNYGDNPTDANYKKWASLRRKNKILSLGSSMLSADTKSGITSILSDSNDNQDVVVKVGQLISRSFTP